MNRNFTDDFGDILDDDPTTEVPLSDIEPLLCPLSSSSDNQPSPLSLSHSQPLPSATSLATDAPFSLSSSGLSPLTLSHPIPHPSASFMTDEPPSFPTSHLSSMSLSHPLRSTSLTLDDPSSFPSSHPSASSFCQPFSLPHFTPSLHSVTEDSSRGNDWWEDQSNPAPVFPPPLTQYPPNPTPVFPTPLPHKSQNLEPAFQTLPQCSSASFSDSSYQAFYASHQGSCGQGIVWGVRDGGEVRQQQHTPTKSLASQMRKSGTALSTFNWSGPRDLPAIIINSQHPPPWMKKKMYELDEQQNPELEMKRQRAINRKQERDKRKIEKLGLQHLLARISDENDRDRKEKARLEENIKRLEEKLGHENTSGDKDPKPGSSFTM